MGGRGWGGGGGGGLAGTLPSMVIKVDHKTQKNYIFWMRCMFWIDDSDLIKIFQYK